jgi:hypothetical protein
LGGLEEPLADRDHVVRHHAVFHLETDIGELAFDET